VIWVDSAADQIKWSPRPDLAHEPQAPHAWDLDVSGLNLRSFCHRSAQGRTPSANRSATYAISFGANLCSVFSFPKDCRCASVTDGHRRNVSECKLLKTPVHSCRDVAGTSHLLKERCCSFVGRRRRLTPSSCSSSNCRTGYSKKCNICYHKSQANDLTISLISTFHSGFVNWFGWFAKRSLPVCFPAIVLRSFAPSQDTFEKSPKRKNSHHRRLRRVWAQESV